MLLLKLFFILLILASTLLAAVFPFHRKIRHPDRTEFPSGEALASGIFLGAGLIHMLGEATKDFDRLGYDYPFAFLLAGLMFLLLLFFEHLGREIHHHEKPESIGFVHLTIIMLSVHSFLEGTALGLSSSLSVMLIILVAIMAHKWAASFALAVQISKSALSVRAGLVLFAVFTLMTPIGILSGTAVINNIKSIPLAEPVFLSLAAGTFLYLGTLHGLKRAVMIEKCCDLRHFVFVVIGFILMAVVATWT